MMRKVSDTEKARMRERYSAFKAAGLCPQCGKQPQAGMIMCTDCNEKRLAWHERNRARSNASARALREKLWDRVLVAYGPYCSCCSEARREFLTVDHVNGGGRAERALLRTTAMMLRKIIKDSFPPTIRILCMNCNLSYGVRGYCPHQKEP